MSLPPVPPCLSFFKIEQNVTTPLTPNWNWNNEFVKEILLILKETEDDIDKLLNPEKKWSNSVEEIYAVNTEVNYQDKLEERKINLLGKISILVKKILGHDLDFCNSIFSDNNNIIIISSQYTKTIFKNITLLCEALQLPEQMINYVHLVIFSKMVVKYLCTLEYLDQVNLGTDARDLENPAKIISSMRIPNSFGLNFLLPSTIRFNKLRVALKRTIDEKYHIINEKILKYNFHLSLRPTLLRRSELGQACEDRAKIIYHECYNFLVENCFTCFDNFKVAVRPVNPEKIFVNPIEYFGDGAAATVEELPENTIPLTEDALNLNHPANVEGNQTEEATQQIDLSLFADVHVLLRRLRTILPDPNHPAQSHAQSDMDDMSQTNSSISEELSDGLPSYSREVASDSGSGTTSSSGDLFNPLAAKRIKLGF